MFFECLRGHSLQNSRRRPREEFVPTTFRLKLGEEPCADGFLVVLRQLVRFFDRTLKKFTHVGQFYAILNSGVSRGLALTYKTLMRALHPIRESYGNGVESTRASRLVLEVEVCRYDASSATARLRGPFRPDLRNRRSFIESVPETKPVIPSG